MIDGVSSHGRLNQQRIDSLNHLHRLRLQRLVVALALTRINDCCMCARSCAHTISQEREGTHAIRNMKMNNERMMLVRDCESKRGRQLWRRTISHRVDILPEHASLLIQRVELLEHL